LQTTQYDSSFEVEEHLFLGNQAWIAGNYDEATNQYQKALRINDKEWRGHYGLGNVFFARAVLIAGKVDRSIMAKAIEEYEIAVRLSKYETRRGDAEFAVDVSELFSDLAQAYLYSNDPAKAQEKVAVALDLNDRSATAVRRQGSIYLMQGKTNEAINEYQRSIAINDKDPQTHIALGAAYFQKFRKGYSKESFDKSAEQYKIAADLSPVDGNQVLGKFYYQNAKYAQAITPFEKALALNPKLEEARYELADSYYQTGKKDLARKQYEELVRMGSSKAYLLKQRFPDIAASPR
jgi:tetratricopeptide (TPR) repeat protein